MSIRKSDRIISVEHVSKYFGEKAVLNDVNLQVRKGEFVTILGLPVAERLPCCVSVSYTHLTLPTT